MALKGSVTKQDAYQLKQLAALRARYAKSQQEIENLIAKGAYQKGTAAYKQGVVDAIAAEVRALDEYTKAWADGSIRNFHAYSVEDTWAWFRRNSVPITNHVIPDRAVRILTENFTNKMSEGCSWVGRRAVDKVREAGLEGVSRTLAAGGTYKDTIRAVEEELKARKIASITDKRGRPIRLDDYASTVAASTMREATNQGTIDACLANGQTLVQMTHHSSACPLCAQFEGRVYDVTRSIGDKHGDYPSIEHAFPNYNEGTGYANVHPNCGHSMTPYIPELDDNAAATKDFSNREFKDDREAKKKQKYIDDQKKKIERSKTENEWKDIKSTLGDGAPTLEQYAKMKAAGGKDWDDLQARIAAERAKVAEGLKPKVKTPVELAQDDYEVAVKQAKDAAERLRTRVDGTEGDLRSFGEITNDQTSRPNAKATMVEELVDPTLDVGTAIDRAADARARVIREKFIAEKGFDPELAANSGADVEAFKRAANTARTSSENAMRSTYSDGPLAVRKGNSTPEHYRALGDWNVKMNDVSWHYYDGVGIAREDLGSAAEMRRLMRVKERSEKIAALVDSDDKYEREFVAILMDGDPVKASRMMFLQERRKFAAAMQARWDATDMAAASLDRLGDYIELRKNAIWETLADIRPFGGTVEFGGGSYTGTIKDLVDWTQSRFPSDWVQKADAYWKSKSNPPKIISKAYGGKKREYAQRFKYGETQVSLWDKTTRSTAVHEFGHVYDDMRGTRGAVMVSYRHRRTVGEKDKWLGKGYSKDERAKFDKWQEPYTGKVYIGDMSSEMPSMGMQHLYDGWTDFRKNDPEFYRFVLGWLGGF